MGVVYLAEQTEPVTRKVAVKVIRTGLEALGAAERFAAERQALARLSHPAIAQMYEAGKTEDDFPYFGRISLWRRFKKVSIRNGWLTSFSGWLF